MTDSPNVAQSGHYEKVPTQNFAFLDKVTLVPYVIPDEPRVYIDEYLKSGAPWPHTFIVGCVSSECEGLLASLDSAKMLFDYRKHPLDVVRRAYRYNTTEVVYETQEVGLFGSERVAVGTRTVTHVDEGWFPLGSDDYVVRDSPQKIYAPDGRSWDRAERLALLERELLPVLGILYQQEQLLGELRETSKRLAVLNVQYDAALAEYEAVRRELDESHGVKLAQIAPGESHHR